MMNSMLRTVVSAIGFIFVFAGWATAEQGYEQPEWFDGNRVQAHTRLGNWHLDNPMFYTAAEKFEKMGVQVFTRVVKGGSEGCWWPSKVGKMLPEAEGKNLVTKMLDNAHSRGMRMIGYYRHMVDDAAAAEHPEWICRMPDGTPIPAKRGKAWMCLNTGWREFVKVRLVELAQMGVDGIYFDYFHMPGGNPWFKKNCCCQACREKFRKIYGRKMPVRYKINLPSHKLIMDFYNRTIIETFKEWTEAVHASKPDCVMVVATTFSASMYAPVVPSTFVALVDSAKTEWNKAWHLPQRVPEDVLMPDKDVRFGGGFGYLRGACDERPPHCWINPLWTAEEALSASAACMTYGLIANLDTREYKLLASVGWPVMGRVHSMIPSVFHAYHKWEVKPIHTSLVITERWDWKTVTYALASIRQRSGTKIANSVRPISEVLSSRCCSVHQQWS
jgi:hypothetical protein